MHPVVNENTVLVHKVLHLSFYSPCLLKDVAARPVCSVGWVRTCRPSTWSFLTSLLIYGRQHGRVEWFNCAKIIDRVLREWRLTNSPSVGKSDNSKPHICLLARRYSAANGPTLSPGLCIPLMQKKIFEVVQFAALFSTCIAHNFLLSRNWWDPRFVLSLVRRSKLAAAVDGTKTWGNWLFGTISFQVAVRSSFYHCTLLTYYLELNDDDMDFLREIEERNTRVSSTVTFFCLKLSVIDTS